MKEQLRQFFRIPCEVKDAFWEDAVRKNRVTLLLVSIMIFGMELFNMGRVLFMTESRLGTANNRRYFFMYLTLFLGRGAAACVPTAVPPHAGPRPLVHPLRVYALLFLLAHCAQRL